MNIETPLTRKAPHQQQMRRIPCLLSRANVPKCETIQTRLARIAVNGGYRQEHRPRNKPNGEEYLDHHTEETDEEVCVQAILIFDIVNICVVYFERPFE